jgi:hypothetical protein
VIAGICACCHCVICAASLSPTNATRLCAECKLTARNGDMDAECWLPIIGFIGWEISDHGRIRDAKTHTIREPDRSHRYPRVWLNGRRRYVHHLLAETWLGPRPWGRLVLHGDDDPANTHIANIAYGSHADNAADARRNRTKVATDG